MHRDRRLRPLSRDHHHVLALARQLEQATSWDQRDAQALERRVTHELAEHYAQEEELLVPALLAAGADALAAELLQRHQALLTLADRVKAPDLETARRLGAALAQHVRWEERELLTWCQQNLSDEALEHAAKLPLTVQRAPEHAPLPQHQPIDVLSIDVLRRLVDTFYARVRDDGLLGPVFEGAVHDWPAHLDKLTQFWSQVMLGTHEYSGNPMIAHVRQRAHITPAHFDQWLALWKQVTESMLTPHLAQSLQGRAERMAHGLRAGLFGPRGETLRYERGAAR